MRTYVGLQNISYQYILHSHWLRCEQLVSIPIPKQPWDHVTMDRRFSLPKTLLYGRDGLRLTSVTPDVYWERRIRNCSSPTAYVIW